MGKIYTIYPFTVPQCTDHAIVVLEYEEDFLLAHFQEGMHVLNAESDERRF